MKAIKTIKLVEEAIEKDQGNKYRSYLQKILPYMEDAYRVNNSPFRSHLGASLIGRDCPRQLWYSFRWYKKPNLSGRLIRLFNRGHLEEARFIASLLSAGIKVYQQDNKGKQFRFIGENGHFAGSCDGIALGIPDIPENAPCLLEFKTHNAKSFQKLEKEGMRSAKLEHYVQMQIYMREFNLDYGLYAAVNKDNDEYYFEIVEKDKETADQYLNRANKIVWLKSPPKRISDSPGWFECRFCEYNKVCFLKEGHFECCRNCKYSQPSSDSNWQCLEYNKIILKEKQDTKCINYEPIDA